jgi:hypothetical protein
VQDGPLKTTDHFNRLQDGLIVLAKHDRASVIRNLEQWSSSMIHSVSKMGDAASIVTRKRVAVRLPPSRIALLGSRHGRRFFCEIEVP